MSHYRVYRDGEEASGEYIYRRPAVEKAKAVAREHPASLVAVKEYGPGLSVMHVIHRPKPHG